MKWLKNQTGRHSHRSSTTGGRKLHAPLMRSLHQQVSGQDQTQERMASDSDGFPKNPNAVEQARHKAAIEISTLRSLLSYQFKWALPNCPVAEPGSDTRGRNSMTRLLKVPGFYCYTDDRLLPGQIWMVRFYLSLGIEHRDELYRSFLWMTNRYGTVQGTTSGSLFNCSKYGRCIDEGRAPRGYLRSEGPAYWTKHEPGPIGGLRA